MDFALTETQQDIQDLASKILQDNVSVDSLRQTSGWPLHQWRYSPKAPAQSPGRPPLIAVTAR